MTIFCPESWLPLYHLASTWLQLQPNNQQPSSTWEYQVRFTSPNDHESFLLVKVCALAACLPCTQKCVPLVDLLNSLLQAGRNGLPSTSDTLHLGCSYQPSALKSPTSLHSGMRLCSKKKERKKNTLKIFQLIECDDFVCAKLGSMFVSVLKRQRAILEDRYHHTVVWQRYCGKLMFLAFRPHSILCQQNVCILAPFQRQ